MTSLESCMYFSAVVEFSVIKVVITLVRPLIWHNRISLHLPTTLVSGRWLGGRYHIPTTYRPHTDHISTTHWPHTDHIPTTYRPHINHIPTTYQPLTDHIPTTYQPHTDHLPTTYRPHINHLLTTYRPHTDHLPTAYRPLTDNFFTVQLVQYYRTRILSLLNSRTQETTHFKPD